MLSGMPFNHASDQHQWFLESKRKSKANADAIITSGTVADCTQANFLIDGLSAEALLADRGYDSNAILNHYRLKSVGWMTTKVVSG